MPKERLDIWLVQQGLAESREQAQRLVLAGQVQVAGQLADKAGHRYDTALPLAVQALPRFVSRGGDKLEAAFAAFPLDAAGRICVDVGASTGGFTDCLLQHGAARVYAVDVGRGQLHWKLRNDPRVVCIEQVNARYLSAAAVPERPTLAVVDVAFISLTLILPPLLGVLAEPADIVTLIKPQFEAGPRDVGRGGVVRSEAVRQAVIDRLRAFGQDELRLKWLGCCTSPLKGPAGNVEFLAWWRHG